MNTVTADRSKFIRILEWLKQHHRQTSGAVRSLRSAANAQDSHLVADQKRKAADSAAVNAAHFYEIAEALEAVERAERVLNEEMMAAARRDACDSETLLQCYVRFHMTIDKALGLTERSNR